MDGHGTVKQRHQRLTHPNTHPEEFESRRDSNAIDNNEVIETCRL